VKECVECVHKRNHETEWNSRSLSGRADGKESQCTKKQDQRTVSGKDFAPSGARRSAEGDGVWGNPLTLL